MDIQLVSKTLDIIPFIQIRPLPLHHIMQLSYDLVASLSTQAGRWMFFLSELTQKVQKFVQVFPHKKKFIGYC